MRSRQRPNNSPTESNIEHPNLAQQSIPNPQHHVAHIIVSGSVEFQDAGVKRRTVPEDKQVFHEPARLLDVTAGDAEHRHGLPEVEPAAGENARPLGLLRLQKREHMAQHSIRQGTDAVGVSH